MENNADYSTSLQASRALSKRGPPRRSPRGGASKISRLSGARDNPVGQHLQGNSPNENRLPTNGTESPPRRDEAAVLTSPTTSRTVTDVVSGQGNAINSPPRIANNDVEVEDREMLNITPVSPDGTPSGLSSEDLPHPEVTSTTGRSRLSRRRMSRNAGQRLLNTVDNDNERGGIVNVPISSPAEQDLQISFNRVKLELLETLRDKKAFSSALITLQEQKDGLEKEVKMLRQQNSALDEAMNASSRSKNGKKPVWSMENLQDTNIATYQGICLAAGDLAKREAKLVTTETYIDEKKNGLRKRNWASSATLVSSTIAKESKLFVHLPDGSFAIPTSCMMRATSKEHYLSPYGDEKGFAMYCIKKILSSPVGSTMNEDEKQECQTLILAHRQTIRKFKAVLSDSVGNRKKSTLSVFLRTLGYLNGTKPNSDKLTPSQKAVRTAEREMIYEKCVNVDENGKLDTMFWRLSNWSSMCIDNALDSVSARNMEEAERVLDSEGQVDNLFLNESSRRAFNELRGHQVCDERDVNDAHVSIISIARADAAMTTMLKWIKVDGRGGVRNTNYNDCFRELLPSAMEAIIKDIWDDLDDLVPHEMVPYMQHQESSNLDVYGNDVREWTCVLKSPVDGYLYLLAKPKYIERNVCSWLGCVQDCHVGRCLPTENKFTRLDTANIDAALEESDIEEG